MWNRADLKARGKIAFQMNYWKCVLVALILTISLGGNAVRSTLEEVRDRTPGETVTDATVEVFNDYRTTLTSSPVARIVGTASIINLGITLLVLNPINIGCHRFFKENSYMPAEYGEIIWAFKNSYGRNVLSLLLMGVYLTLWYMLFIIPGIIKTYSYRLVPYILADDPTIDANDAITLSRKMMKGHKWDAFVLDLSFIGWIFLSVLTIGFLGLFYVLPYRAATDAEMYRFLKENAEN